MSDTILLKKPLFKSEKTLFFALQNRKSSRKYLKKMISKQNLSELLWAANGINRENGNRTAPSAMNAQNIDIYLILNDGVYKYCPQKHLLKLIINGNYQKLAGTQDFSETAPVNFLFVAKQILINGKALPPEQQNAWSNLTIGYISQNIYLYCAAEGLATVARALIDKNALKKLLNLDKNDDVLLAQSVGYHQV